MRSCPSDSLGRFRRQSELSFYTVQPNELCKRALQLCRSILTGSFRQNSTFVNTFPLLDHQASKATASDREVLFVDSLRISALAACVSLDLADAQWLRQSLLALDVAVIDDAPMLQSACMCAHFPSQHPGLKGYANLNRTLF